MVCSERNFAPNLGGLTKSANAIESAPTTIGEQSALQHPNASSSKAYDYLLNMPLRSLTQENVNRLQSQARNGL